MQVISQSVSSQPIYPRGSELAAGFLNKTFYLELEDVFINDFGERQSNYCISDFDISSGTFQSVLRFYGSTGQLATVPNTTIDWSNPRNLPVDNEPRCEFSGQKAECSSGEPKILVIGGTFGVVLFIILAFGGMVFNRYEEQVRTL